ncbi:MAG: Holliday junction branch migration DNA helicase RuvB [Bacilli bacterium]|nr:Holliday junction branch migration DNA helicase RuvB [Bacilli bacterium]
MKERLLDARKEKEDEGSELSLRPQRLSEYIGQVELKKNLRVFISAAKKRKEPLDHVLLYGPPGLGKTTLAYVIANEMGGKIHTINGPAIEKSGDLAAMLNELEAGDVLFIDEIHRLPRVVEEVLYGAMEDFQLSFMINADGTSKALTLPLPPFTLVGATTRAGDLSAPLRARFGITSKIDFYPPEDLQEIVGRTARVLEMPILPEAAELISRRARGTPRIANRIYRRVRDFATYEGKDVIDVPTTEKALDALKIDSLGLDGVDVKYLTAIMERFHGGPVGIETIASAIGEEIQNLEDVYEPYLLMIGLIDRTPRGRVATEKAYKHLKKAHQGSLF